VTRPKVLLLDEPLSNLDARLRDQLRFELKRIQREFGVTTLYVTHDQHEALSLSDRIVVMRAGEIEQIGTPAEIYDKPASQFVTEFIGDSNCVAGKAENARGVGADRRCDVVTDLGVVPHVVCADDLGDGAEVTLAIRPHRAVLTTEHDDGRISAKFGHGLAIAGSVSTAAFNGESRDYVVAVGSRELRVRAGAADAVPVGASVGVFLPSAACMLTARGDG
jgi:ABC-type Fe3+/spermidine/putrescine transport system ATPase subunit